MDKLAYELQVGDTIRISAGIVTIADIYRRDNEWISNGVVFFVATDGCRYGLSGDALVTVL